jgi:hypothetical protein
MQPENVCREVIRRLSTAVVDLDTLAALEN